MRASLVRPENASRKCHASIFQHGSHFLRVVFVDSLMSLEDLPSLIFPPGPSLVDVASGYCEGLCHKRWWVRADTSVCIRLPPRFSHKSDQSLKVESVRTLQQVLLTFLVKPFIKLSIVLLLCPQTLCFILMPIRSVRLTAKGR